MILILSDLKKKTNVKMIEYFNGKNLIFDEYLVKVKTLGIIGTTT